MNPILHLDYAGIAVFAATGALAASRKQLDIIGFLFLAAATGIGGGTLRDLILGAPVFWVKNSAYVQVCAAVAILVFFGAHRSSCAGSCCFGSTPSDCPCTRSWGQPRVSPRPVRRRSRSSPACSPPPSAASCATCWPANLRSCSGPKSTSRRQWPVPRAFTLCDLAGAGPLASATAGFLVAFAIRGGAIRYGWTFPSYKSRPGRRPEDIP